MDAPPPPPPAAPPGAPSTGWSPPAAPAWAPPPPQRSSRRWLYAAGAGVAVVVIVLVLAVVGTRTGTPTSTSTSPVAASFTDPTHHFSAAYHDTPVQDNQTTTVAGRTINEVLWTDTIDNNTAEIVGYVNFSNEFNFSAPNAALDGSVTGEVANVHGMLVSKKFGTYQGFQSVDAVISAAGGYIETRAVLAGRTLYIVVVTSQNNPPELFSGFASSLHVLNHSS